MAELTIGEARNRFSALIAELVNGTAQEHIIKKRNVPVARIVPIDAAEANVRRFGVTKDAPLIVDDDVFDQLDLEIEREFGM